MLEELKLELEFIGPVELIALDVLLIAEDDEVSILELLETEEELSSMEMAELTALLISLLDDDESTELTSLLTLLTTLLLALLILLELLLLFELPPHAVSVSAIPIHVTKGNNFIWTSLYYFYAHSSVVEPTFFTCTDQQKETPLN